MQIHDGTGKGYGMQINDENRALTHAVTEPEKGHAIEFGYGYNINTGTISISAASALLYFINNEDRDFIIEAIAVGCGAGTTSDSGVITVYRNPTTGTLISGASAVDMYQNRNFGSSLDISTTSPAYKGASGNTITNGDAIALFYQGASSRGYYTVDMHLPKGSSIGVHIDPNLSSGNMNVYMAIVGYLKPFTEE